MVYSEVRGGVLSSRGWSLVPILSFIGVEIFDVKRSEKNYNHEMVT
jgi:hypothetical protein